MSSPFLGLLLVLFLSPLRPQAERYDLYDLVAMADRVVAGTIVRLQEKTFDLVVDRDLFGSGARELHLRRFIGFDGNDELRALSILGGGGDPHRWSEYRVGQQVVLFLSDNQVMGLEAEGDWPLLDGECLAPYRIHGIEWATKTLNGEKIGGTPRSLADLGSALTGYRKCFRTSYRDVEGGQQLVLDYALDSAAAEAFARSSTLARHLYEETLSSWAFRNPEPTPPPLGAKPAIRACADGFCPPEPPWGDWDSQFGVAIAALGDVNGDGWDDLAVQGDRLTVWILLLDRTGRPLARHHVEPHELGIGGLFFGQALAGAGDFDGDGVPDLAVASEGREKTDRGRVLVLLLDKAGGVKKVLEISGPALDEASKLCRSEIGDGVTSVGDVDGNGSVDLLVSVGVDLELWETRKKPDPYHLLCLDKSGSVLRASPLVAEAPPWEVKRGMAGIGDLDGDGLSEIAIGSPSDCDGGVVRGAVRIHFLRRDCSLRSSTKLSDWSGDFESRLFDGDQFGWTLTAPGDLDGDEVPDLVVSGERELWILLMERDGTVKESRAFGHRSGGFVPVEMIRSLAVLRGPENALRLVVAGVSEGDVPREAALWVLTLGPGPVLSAP